jgi:hypothetical protein
MKTMKVLMNRARWSFGNAKTPTPFAQQMVKTMKRVVSFGSALAVVMALFMLAGCGDAAGGPTGGLSLEKTALGTSISQAETALNETGKSDTSGANVAVGTPWVTTADWNAFQGKITTAKGVFNSPGSQSQIDTAAAALDDEREEFVANRNPSGAGPALDKGALDAEIATAKAARNSVLVSGDGSDVSPSLKWVTQTALNTLDAAIATAENVRNSATSQPAIDNAVGPLNTALTAFTGAAASGTQNTPFDAAQLAALVNLARAAQTGVMLADSANDVPPNRMFVTLATMNALNNAIAAAEAGGGDANDLYTALETALNNFNAEKVTGTVPTKTALETNIAAAGSAMAPKPFIAASAGEAPLGKAWVTQEEWNAIETAYTAALPALGPNATKNQVDAAASALGQATSAFTSAKSANGLGEKPASVTITGIPAGTTNLFVGLFANMEDAQASLDGTGDPLASGAVSSPGTSETMPLLDADDDPWGGSGSAIIALVVTNGSGEPKLYVHANGTTAVSHNLGLHPWVSLGFSAFRNVGWPADFGELYIDNWSGTLDAFFQMISAMSYAQFLATVPNPDDYRFYSDIWLTQAVTGAYPINTAAHTILYSRLPAVTDGLGPQVGSISGTITLNDIPASNKPRVTISAFSPGTIPPGGGDFWYSSTGARIALTGSGTQTISWTSPLSQDDADRFGGSPRTDVEFILSVSCPDAGDSSFSISLMGPYTVSAANTDTDLGNIGTASVAYITLSGTLNISYNGQAVPSMRIHANASGSPVGGSAYIAGNSATSGIPWIIAMPPFANQTSVSFDISRVVMTSPNEGMGQVIVTNHTPTNVHNTNVSGIVLNVGNITGD